MPNYAYFNQLAVEVKGGEKEGGACVLFYKETDGKTYLLFQKRAKTIENGGFFDLSSGGHIDEGETALIAALRETEEEIGVTLSEEELIFLISYATKKKFINVYLSDRTGKNDVFTPNPDEVEALEWVSLEDLDDFIQTRMKKPLRKDPFWVLAVKVFFQEKSEEKPKETV